jgi:hypothetical protein
MTWGCNVPVGFNMDHRCKIKCFESGYFMRDLDPAGGFQQAQKYD